MKIKVIDYGGKFPTRKHYNDAGADCYLKEQITLSPHESYAAGLGIGLALPDGFAAYVIPRSSVAKIGIECAMSPVDSGYTGEIHAILHNTTADSITLNAGDRVGQLVIMPVILADFVTDFDEQPRGADAFGSTGK